MEIIALTIIVILLFWGTIRNFRTAGEVSSLGVVAAATKYTATNAKEISAEELAIVEALRKL